MISATELGQGIIGLIVIVSAIVAWWGARTRATVAVSTAQTAHTLAEATHSLVNSQKDRLEAKLAGDEDLIRRQDARIAALEAILARTDSTGKEV